MVEATITTSRSTEMLREFLLKSLTSGDIGWLILFPSIFLMLIINDYLFISKDCETLVRQSDAYLQILKSVIYD